MAVNLLAKGAEADIYLDDGEVVKERVKKEYRTEELDERLRLSRTRREAKLLSLARRSGVSTPLIRDVLPEEHTINLSYIEGKKLKDEVPKLKNLREVFTQVGRQVGRLHSAHIIHGDLTTSNMLLSQGMVYFIDFGLGEVAESPEAKGTDLLVFKKSVHSSHYDREEEILESFFRGYRDNYEASGKVLERLKLMEKRGRYFSER